MNGTYKIQIGTIYHAISLNVGYYRSIINSNNSFIQVKLPMIEVVKEKGWLCNTQTLGRNLHKITTNIKLGMELKN